MPLYLRKDCYSNRGEGDGHVEPSQEGPFIGKKHLGLDLDGDFTRLIG